MAQKLKNYIALLFISVAGISTSQTVHALENNTFLENLSARAGQEIRHTVTIPEGARQLSIAISGGTGDADLYVRIGSAPTTNRFHCRPYSAGNWETCSANRLRAGTYHIMVRAYRTFNGVKLRVAYSEPAKSAPVRIPANPAPAAAETPAAPETPATSAPPATPNPTTPQASESNSQTPTSGISCINEVEQALLDAHNAARSQGRSCGGTFYPAVPQLQWSCELRQAATAHSNDMGSINYFSHTGSDGSSAGQRISAAGYLWRAWGENIAAGQPTVDIVMNGWIDSPGHCQNLMSDAFTEMGAARIIAPGSDYDRYWTVNFARPR